LKQEPVSSDYVPASQSESPWPFPVIGWLYYVFTGPTTIALAVALGGLLALYIYFQVLSLVATLATLPAWFAAIAVVLLSLLIGVVVVAIARLIIKYIRLRPNKQVFIGDIEQLRRHEQIRRGFSQTQRGQQARAVLEEYVRNYPEYPLEKAAHHPGTSRDAPLSQTHAALGPLFTEEQLEQLCQVKRRLTDPTRVKDTTQWLKIYETEFQAVLDKVAQDRVAQCAKWVGVKTAISPNALADTLITTYWCVVLLRDLCTIYNVRVGGYGTAALLWRVFFSAYVAGKLDEWEEHASDTLESIMDELPEFIPNIVQNFVAKVAAKGATGLANYVLVRRLGMRAIAMLQPLAVKKK